MSEPQVTNIRKLVINKCTEEQYNAMVKNADELYLTPDTGGGGGGGSGTVTSVRVQATSPVVSSQSTEQTTTLNTTISLANNYGDTKNPYASKTANYVLAAPVSANGTPSFRALDKADIPLNDIIDDSTITKNSNDQIQTIGVKDVRTDNTIKIWTGTKAQYDAIPSGDWSVATRNSNLSNNRWDALSYGANKFVAIGQGGYISTSTDGITWTVATENSTLAIDCNWDSLIYDGSKFIVLSFEGYISTSTDGITWTTPTLISNLGNNYWLSMAYDGTKFVVIGRNGYISTSTDGITWTVATENSDLGSNNWTYIFYYNSKFIALGNTGYISTSSDGTTWTTATQNSNLANNNDWRAFTYDGTQLIAISYNGYISTSSDGTTWTTPTLISNLGNNYWREIVCNNTTCVALSFTGYISIKTNKEDNILYNIKNYGLYLGTIPVADNTSDVLPSQSGQNGKFLTTNGTSVSWGVVGVSKFLTFTNVSASTWVADNTYQDYGYKCVLTCNGVTSNDYAQVIFNPTEASSGNYANVCLTGIDTVTIYSKVNISITILSIIILGA